MAGRPTVLDGQVFGKLLESLRGGAFDWVAAEGAGISRSTFYRWMARGDQGDGSYVVFAREVRQAKAQARMRAEGRVLEQNPLSWLRLGPGRERRGEPGWTGEAKAQVDTPPEERAAEAGSTLADELEQMLQDLEDEEQDEGGAGERESGGAGERVSGKGV